jgi:hypothetical protein
VQREYDCNNEKLVEYLAEVHRIQKFFDRFKVWYVPRLDNRDSDHLVWNASSRAPTPPDVIIEKLSKPSVRSVEPTNEAIEQNFMIIDEPEHELVYDWMHPIKMFLENQPPSDDNAEVKHITHKSKQYHLKDGILFQRGATDMMMKCISREESIQLL